MLLRTGHWLLLHSNTSYYRVPASTTRPVVPVPGPGPWQLSLQRTSETETLTPLYQRCQPDFTVIFTIFSDEKRWLLLPLFIHWSFIGWPLHKYYLVSKTIFLYTIFSIKYYTGVLKSIIIKYFQFKTRSNIVQT